MTNAPRPTPGPLLPGDVPDVDRLAATPAIAPGEEKVPAGQAFSTFMQEGKGAGAQVAASGKAPMVSPFDLAQGKPVATPGAPTLDTLKTQVINAQSTLGDLSTNMNTPGLKLKPSQKYLLKNKLSDANTKFRVANNKMGAQVPDEPPASDFKGPLGKFLAMLTDGQQQMQAAQQQLQSMKDKGTSLQPADFLMIQVKMNQAQQELEYSSVLLSNAVGSLKQLMQVQL
jgi:hypothetical protein